MCRVCFFCDVCLLSLVTVPILVLVLVALPFNSIGGSVVTPVITVGDTRRANTRCTRYKQNMASGRERESCVADGKREVLTSGSGVNSNARVTTRVTRVAGETVSRNPGWFSR